MNMILMDHGVYHDVFIDLVEDIIMYVFVIVCLIKIDIVYLGRHRISIYMHQCSDSKCLLFVDIIMYVHERI